MHRALGPVAACLLPALLAACAPVEPTPARGPGPTAPEASAWAERVERLGAGWEAAGSTPVAGDAAAARARLREDLLGRLAEAAVRDALGEGAAPDPAGLREVLRGRASWLGADRTLREGTWGDPPRVGLRVRVEPDAGELRAALEAAGLLATARARVIVVLRPGEAEGAAEAARAHEADLAETISGELAARGWVPRLWQDVRLELARAAVPGGPPADPGGLAAGFVEGGEWRRPDERYDLPLLLLRAQGRYLAGFRIVELARTRTELRPPGEAAPIPVDSLQLTLRGDLYDLLHGVSFGMTARTRAAAITPGRTEAAVRQALVVELARDLARELAGSLAEAHARERRLRARTYTLVFEGYEPVEQERVEWLLSQVVAEDVAGRRNARQLVVEVEVARDAVPLREELRRALAALDLAPSAIDREADRLVFRR